MAYIATVEELSGRKCSIDDIVTNYALGPGTAMLEALLGRPCQERDLALYHDNLRRRCSLVRIYPGIEASLQVLTGVLKLGVFTGAGRGAAEILLGHTGLRKYFDVLVTGDDVTRPKPAPDGVLAACSALSVLPAEAAYVGDAPADGHAASGAGALAVAAGWGHQFDPIARSDVAISDPADLIDLALRAEKSTTTTGDCSQSRLATLLTPVLGGRKCR